MAYFSKIKLNEEVFSLIYGKGKVSFVLKKELRIAGFYALEVTFESNKKINYTVQGYPNWCSKSHTNDVQTLFCKHDIDVNEIHFEPIEECLDFYKIKKLLKKDKLEMRCPSGIWRATELCPKNLVQELLTEKNTHLFRKKI